MNNILSSIQRTNGPIQLKTKKRNQISRKIRKPIQLKSINNKTRRLYSQPSRKPQVPHESQVTIV